MLREADVECEDSVSHGRLRATVERTTPKQFRTKESKRDRASFASRQANKRPVQSSATIDRLKQSALLAEFEWQDGTMKTKRVCKLDQNCAVDVKAGSE